MLGRVMDALRRAGHPDSVGWNIIDDVFPGTHQPSELSDRDPSTRERTV